MGAGLTECNSWRWRGSGCRRPSSLTFWSDLRRCGGEGGLGGVCFLSSRVEEDETSEWEGGRWMVMRR